MLNETSENLSTVYSWSECLWKVLFLSLLLCLVAKPCPTLCDPMDYVACQAPLSVGLPRQEYWSGLPFPSPGQPTRDWTWQTDSLLPSHQGSPWWQLPRSRWHGNKWTSSGTLYLKIMMAFSDSRNRNSSLPAYLFLWKWKSLSRVQLFVTPWTIQSMEFCRPEYWNG